MGLSLLVTPMERNVHQIIERLGEPQIICVYNRPENVRELLRPRAEKHAITIKYIDLGKPQQDAYVEH